MNGKRKTSEQIDTATANERGAALLLVVVILAIMATALLTSAVNFQRVAAAQGVEDQIAVQQDVASSYAAVLESGARYRIPEVYEAQVAQARAIAPQLPSFDPPEVPVAQSRPIIDPNTGQPTGTNPSQATSLLGNFSVWLTQQAQPAAEALVQMNGIDPQRVKFYELREAYRAGAGSGEPIYAFEFTIDARPDNTSPGVLRTRGVVALGAARGACQTSATLDIFPSTIQVGQQATVSVNYTAATTLTLIDANTGQQIAQQNVPFSPAPQTATFTVNPQQTTSYRVRASAGDPNCDALTGARTLTVNWPPPEIVVWNAQPACTTDGNTVTLQWRTRYATQVSIDGQPQTVSDPLDASGSKQVAPNSGGSPRTITYTLTATGPGGSAQATTSVQIYPPLAIDSFTADQSCAVAGQQVTLSWVTRGATAAQLNGNPVPTTGSTIVTAQPGQTSYTLVISRTGCNGTETQTRTIQITGVSTPQINVAAAPTTTVNEPLTISYQIANASAATLSATPAAGSGVPGGSMAINPNGSSVSITPSSAGTYTYTITATNQGCRNVSNSASITVQVQNPPPPPPPTCPVITSFTADDSCLVAGQSTTLRWSAQDFDSVTISGPGVNQTFFPPQSSGAVSVTPPSGASTYTLTAARNSCAPVVRQLTINASSPPVINAFNATPNAIQPGGTATLQWDVAGAASVTISGPGVNQTVPNSGTLNVQPTSTSSYTLTATSGGCNPQTVQQTVTVVVQPCSAHINSFSASSLQIYQGQQATIAWDTSGGNTTLNGNPVSPQGTLTVAPNSTTTYTLAVSNGSCGEQQQLTIQVLQCQPPTITSFTATPSQVTAGGSQIVRLQWQSDADSVEISGVGTGLPASGFVDIQQPQSTTTYTLIARKNCGAQSQASVQVSIASSGNFCDWNDSKTVGTSFQGQSVTYNVSGTITLNPDGSAIITANDVDYVGGGVDASSVNFEFQVRMPNGTRKTIVSGNLNNKYSLLPKDFYFPPGTFNSMPIVDVLISATDVVGGDVSASLSSEGKCETTGYSRQPGVCTDQVFLNTWIGDYSSFQTYSAEVKITQNSETKSIRVDFGVEPSNMICNPPYTFCPTDYDIHLNLDNGDVISILIMYVSPPQNTQNFYPNYTVGPLSGNLVRGSAYVILPDNLNVYRILGGSFKFGGTNIDSNGQYVRVESENGSFNCAP